jgi:hypothetical protein
MVVRFSALRPGSPGRSLALISLKGLLDPMATLQPEGLDQLKNVVTLSKIEPAAFRLIV